MLMLRQAFRATDPGWSESLHGWNQLGDQPHCTWDGVRCDADGYVTNMWVAASMLTWAGMRTACMCWRAPMCLDRWAHPARPGAPHVLMAKSCLARACSHLVNSTTAGSVALAEALAPPGRDAPALAGRVLLPELARLTRLEALTLERPRPEWQWAGIPPEWGAPGAFPRLES